MVFQYKRLPRPSPISLIGVLALLSLATVHASNADAKQPIQDVQDMLSRRPLELDEGELLQGCISTIEYAPKSPLREQPIIRSIRVIGGDAGHIDIILKDEAIIPSIGDCLVLRVAGPTFFWSEGEKYLGTVSATITDQHFEPNLAEPLPTDVEASPRSAEITVDEYFDKEIALGDRATSVTGTVTEIFETTDKRSIGITMQSRSECRLYSYYDLVNINKKSSQFQIMKNISPGDIITMSGYFLVETPCNAVFRIGSVSR